ncbi:MAG: DUF4411 family protein [Chloroflexi bacterium]|nr:DUF4411 family protein [Chloroflexota bacterium]
MTPPSVWVLDTSSVICPKELAQPQHQPDVFAHMTQLVQQGQIGFPKQVLEELQRYAKEDLPLQWARANYNRKAFPNPSMETLRRVMAIAGDVVDPMKLRPDADPYVLAMALEFLDEGRDVVVVTEDTVDRPSHISMATACDRLKLKWSTMRDFLADKGIWPLP